MCIPSYNNFSRPKNEVEEDVYQDGSVVEDNYTGARLSGSGGSVDGTILEGRHDWSPGARAGGHSGNQQHCERYTGIQSLYMSVCLS
jgi:hypothetical protein